MSEQTLTRAERRVVTAAMGRWREKHRIGSAQVYLAAMAREDAECAALERERKARKGEKRG